MRLVLLYSSDGFDLDVLTNQRELYETLGFKVVWGRVMIPCDLIVVLRCMESDTINPPHSTPLLFLDYSGQDVLSVFQQTNTHNKRCITSLRTQFKDDKIHFGHPYVSIHIQSNPLDNLVYDYVHIGNYKPKRWLNMLKRSFDSYCVQVKASVWGKNWPVEGLLGVNYNGALRPEKVSTIYAKSKIALGVKHDFQIGRAISGRYWHAPLNGCILLVEDDNLVNEIPGVFTYDFEGDFPNRETLQEEARKFWRNSNNLQKKLSLDLIEQSDKRKLLNFVYYNLYALYSALYERYRLSTYGKV